MKTNTEYNRTRLIALAGWVALYGNLALAAGKLAVGIRAQSLAVIGDGLDTAADVVIAVMTLLVSRVISRPADAGHPWGHGRAETAATVVLSFIIFLAGASLAQRAIGQFRSGALSPVPGMLPLVVTGVSIAGKYLLSLSQDFFGKKAGSSMILANGVNMRSDIIISASVLAGLLLSRVFRLPVLDPVTAFLVSLWIMKSGVAVFLEGSTELMDGGGGRELYKALFDAVRSVPGAASPHRARIRKIASRWDIDLDIEVDGALTVRDAHRIAMGVEQAIHAAIPDVYDIVVHVEPANEGERFPGEQYGLSEADVR